MKIYDTLKDNQAVKLGNNYVVQLSKGDYKYNETTFSCSGYQGSQVLIPVNDINNIQKLVKGLRTVVSYTLRDDNSCTVSEYTNAYANYNKFYNDDLEEYTFDSLEHEYEVKKEMEVYKGAIANYEETPDKYEPVTDIEIVGEQLDTGSDYIDSAFDLGLLNFQQSTGAFKVNSLGVIMKELKIITDKKDWSLDIPSHSGIEYVKIEGKYLFTNNSAYKNVRPRIFAKLDEAKEYEQNLRQDISKLVYTKCSDKILSDTELGVIYSKIDSIRDRVISLDVKRKDDAKKRGTITSINELLKTLEQEK